MTVSISSRAGATNVSGARRALFSMLAWAGAAALSGCPAPPTAIARAQQVAQEFNQDARFGRNELTVEHVAPAAREAFAASHRAWGTGVRVADLELEGMQPHGDHELYVIVRVSWYRPEEEELRTTTIKQSWRDEGGWQLAIEKRIDGDVGLLGEPVVYQAPSQSRPHAQFPTVHLGNANEGAEAPTERAP